MYTSIKLSSINFFVLNRFHSQCDIVASYKHCSLVHELFHIDGDIRVLEKSIHSRLKKQIIPCTCVHSNSKFLTILTLGYLMSQLMLCIRSLGLQLLSIILIIIKNKN